MNFKFPIFDLRLPLDRDRFSLSTPVPVSDSAPLTRMTSLLGAANARAQRRDSSKCQSSQFFRNERIACSGPPRGPERLAGMPPGTGGPASPASRQPFHPCTPSFLYPSASIDRRAYASQILHRVAPMSSSAFRHDIRVREAQSATRNGVEKSRLYGRLLPLFRIDRNNVGGCRR